MKVVEVPSTHERNPLDHRLISFSHICTRLQGYMLYVNSFIAFFVEYDSDLLQDIYSETSGHFRDTLMNLAQVLGKQVIFY